MTFAHPITGLCPALLTPIDGSGAVDLPRMLAHAKRLLAAGCDGLTLFGTTGEGTAFSLAERMAVTQSLVSHGIAPEQLIVNLSALARSDAIALGVQAVKIGAKGGMLMPPFYYNAQHEAGLVAYVSEVIDAVNAQTGSSALRVILYHFPSLTGVGFSHGAIEALLTRYPQQVVGLKDSSADVAHSIALAKRFPKLGVLVGCEPDVAPTMVEGGAGSICGLANVAPKLMRRVMDAPHQVSAEDAQRMKGVLALLSIEAGMPFVSVYKVMLAQQTGDAAWLAVRSPLTLVSTEQEQRLRQGFAALNEGLA